VSRPDPSRTRSRIPPDGGAPASARDAADPDDENGDGGAGDGSVELDAANPLELAIVAASVLLVVATLGYVGWQATVTTVDGVPTASVEAVEPMPGSDDDRLRVTVQLDNRRGTGVSSVAVVVRCGGAERSLTFAHVPAGGHRTGTAVCPPDTVPVAAVVTWIEA
jgi:hypothetical protein